MEEGWAGGGLRGVELPTDRAGASSAMEREERRSAAGRPPVVAPAPLGRVEASPRPAAAVGPLCPQPVSVSGGAIAADAAAGTGSGGGW